MMGATQPLAPPEADNEDIPDTMDTHKSSSSYPPSQPPTASSSLSSSSSSLKRGFATKKRRIRKRIRSGVSLAGEGAADGTVADSSVLSKDGAASGSAAATETEELASMSEGEAKVVVGKSIGPRIEVWVVGNAQRWKDALERLGMTWKESHRAFYVQVSKILRKSLLARIDIVLKEQPENKGKSTGKTTKSTRKDISPSKESMGEEEEEEEESADGGGESKVLRVDGKTITSLTSVQLRTQLKQRGLLTTGRKNVLLDRLKDHLEGNQEENETGACDETGKTEAKRPIQEGGEETHPSSDRLDFAKLPVKKLKEMLREKGLPTSGRKADLVDRLEEYWEDEGGKEDEDGDESETQDRQAKAGERRAGGRGGEKTDGGAEAMDEEEDEEEAEEIAGGAEEEAKEEDDSKGKDEVDPSDDGEAAEDAALAKSTNSRRPKGKKRKVGSNGSTKPRRKRRATGRTKKQEVAIPDASSPRDRGNDGDSKSVQWFWMSDLDKTWEDDGAWTPYLSAESSTIEEKYQDFMNLSGKKRVKINSSYSADLKDFLQIRTSDPSRRRPIRRIPPPTSGASLGSEKDTKKSSSKSGVRRSSRRRKTTNKRS